MRWIPLEANPDILNSFMEKVGVKSTWKCIDVYGTDESLLAMIPRPVSALLLLYPLTEAVLNKPIGEAKCVDNLIFIKQTIGNACGTIGLLHMLCNNQHILKDDSYICSFLKKIESLSPEERAKIIETEEFISNIHEEVAKDGQTEAPDTSANTNLHFVSFIHHDNGVYELDGRQSGPKFHGQCQSDDFLFKSIEVIKEFMKRDPEQLNFSIIALADHSN